MSARVLRKRADGASGLQIDVRPAPPVREGEVQRFGFGPKVDAIMSALQGGDRRAGWLRGNPPEPYTYTEARLRGAVLLSAGELYRQYFRGVAVAAVFATDAAGVCSCRRGARCSWPAGGHTLNEWPASFATRMSLMPWEQPRTDLALQMGGYSKLLAVTVAAGATAPEWTAGAMTVTWPDGARTFLFVDVNAAAVPSAPFGDGVQLHGDGALVPVPPRFRPGAITFGWDTLNGAPAPYEDSLDWQTTLPKSVLRQAARAARGSDERRDGKRRDAGVKRQLHGTVARDSHAASVAALAGHTRERRASSRGRGSLPGARSRAAAGQTEGQETDRQ